MSGHFVIKSALLIRDTTIIRLETAFSHFPQYSQLEIR